MLMMGTRCGALDPGVILYRSEHRVDAPAIEALLYRGQGLLGVSGISSDMRRRCGDRLIMPQKTIGLPSIGSFRIGSLVAALDGIDAFVFSGGIGENDAATRMEVIEGCRWMGAVLDPRLTRREKAVSAP